MNPFRWISANLRELLIVALAVAALLWSPTIVRLYDPTAGSLDGSVFQLLAWGGLLFVASILLLWVGLSAAFPTVSKHIDHGQFRRDFAGLTEWQRTLVTLWTLTLLIAFLAGCLLVSHLTAPPTIAPPMLVPTAP